ncbi:UPF0164 family protein [Treponema pallidum]|uniref:UPF0164 family protein n=1 Tax=Treponema pallidum TaxID=160 RepID=UPI000328CA31|nr:putative lipoprotein [Treponema pallidum str. Fribourg-Blanc]
MVHYKSVFYKSAALVCGFVLAGASVAIASSEAAAKTRSKMSEFKRRAVSSPSGGRLSVLDGSFTALANDASFFEANPAGSANMTHSELTFAHTVGFNNSHAETLSYVGQRGNWGYGASMRMFFPESGFDFSPSTGPVCTPASNPIKKLGAWGIVNFSRRFGGLSIGANLKAGFRDAQGLTHLSLGTDVGLQWVGNVAKFFSSAEPNMYVGLSATNLGFTVKLPGSPFVLCRATGEQCCKTCSGRCTGVGTCCNGEKPCCKDCDCNCPCQDEATPGSRHATDTMLRAGFAYRPLSWFLFSVGVATRVNVSNLQVDHLWKRSSYALGMILDPVRFLTLLSGVAVNANGKVRAGVGAEIRVACFQVSASYRYDSTGDEQQGTPHNMSLGASILLGRK